MRTEPLLFADFNGRVEGLSPQIDLLKARVETAMLSNAASWKALRSKNCRRRNRRLDTYTVQARFALAAIYDLAASEATVGDASQ